MRHHRRARTGVLGFALVLVLGAGTAGADWHLVCEKVPVARLVPGTIGRPIVTVRPSTRCQQVWISESGDSSALHNASFYAEDLARVCEELDYPLDRCWERLAGLGSEH